jgi:lysozyme
MREHLKRLLILHEGVRPDLYKCPAGKWTIGVGHNLDANPISMRAALLILEDDVEDVEDQLDEALPWWRRLDDVRQAVLVDMAFNMGVSGLEDFVRTLRCARYGEYEQAADAMLESRWARQVPNRAKRLAQMMRTGLLPKELADPDVHGTREA